MKIGIDLGTTYSLCAYIDEKNNPRIIPDSINADYFNTPSVIAFQRDSCLVGHPAEIFQVDHPESNVYRFIKREMGKNTLLYDDYNRAWLPESISAMILRKIKQDAEFYLDEPVTHAVVTVPAHFSDLQRKATINACKLADLELVDILEEPIAAAYHYGVKHSANDEIIMVYDLGGGTFDVTLLNTGSKGMYVIAVDGDTNLGGKDIDETIMAYMLEVFDLEHGYHPEDSKEDMLLLRKKAEEIKIKFSTPWLGVVKETIHLNRLSISFVLTLEQFLALCNPLLDKSLAITDRCLRKSGLAWADVDRVIMVGGSSIIPAIRTRLLEASKKAEDRLLLFQPHKAIAFGAALYCLSKDNPKADIPPIRQRVMSYDLGIKALSKDGQVINDVVIKKNRPIPCTEKKTYYTHREDQREVALKVIQNHHDSQDLIELGTVNFGPFETLRINRPLEITFEVSAQGTVTLHAKDLESGLEVKESMIDEKTASEILLNDQKNLVSIIKVNA